MTGALWDPPQWPETSPSTPMQSLSWCSPCEGGAAGGLRRASSALFFHISVFLLSALPTARPAIWFILTLLGNCSRMEWERDGMG